MRIPVLSLIVLMVSALSGARASATEEIALGVQDPHVFLGLAAWTPVLINNFSQTVVQGCSFTIRLSEVPSLALGPLNGGDRVISRKGILTSNSIDPNEVHVALDFSGSPLGYGSFEIAWFIITSSSSARSLQNVLLFTDIKVSTAAGDLSLDNILRSVTVFDSRGYYLDMLGNVAEKFDSTVNEADAYYLLSCIARINGSAYGAWPRDLSFTATQADVNEDTTITAYDAALILRHAEGFIARLPVTDSAPPAITPDARLEFGEPVAPDVYRYRVIAGNAAGSISAQAVLQIDMSIVRSIQDVVSSLKGAVAASYCNPATGWCQIALITADPVDQADADLATLVVRHRPGASGAGLTLKSVAVNDVPATILATTTAKAWARPRGGVVLYGETRARNAGDGPMALMGGNALGRIVSVRLLLPGETMDAARAPGVVILTARPGSASPQAAVSARVRQGKRDQRSEDRGQRSESSIQSPVTSHQ